MSSTLRTAPRVHRLGRTGVVVRAAGTAVALGILAAGQALDTNDYFPLGSLSQYATLRDMNGTVNAVYLTADTDTATNVHVPLSQSAVGVGRAEVEGQLGRIVRDPSLLQQLADAYAALHPHRPALRVLHLMRSSQQLHNGYLVGEPQREELAHWTVRVGTRSASVGGPVRSASRPHEANTSA